MKKIIALICVSACGFAQVKTKLYSLNDCLAAAMKNNHVIKGAGAEVKKTKAEKNAWFDLPKTAFMFTQGQFNSIYKYDNTLALSQPLPFPTALSNKKGYLNATVKQAQLVEAATIEGIKYNIKTAYYQLTYYCALHKLLTKEDSVYRNFYKIELKKYAEGKATLLEKIEIEAKLMDISSTLMDVKAQINYNTNVLRLLIQEEEEEISIKCEEGQLVLLPLISDTSGVNENPYLKAQCQQIDLIDKQMKMERAGCLPDFSVGYFNLSIYGPANIGNGDYFLTKQNRLSGFTVGMNVPLWFYPSTQKVKAVKIQKEITEHEYQNQKHLMTGELRENIEKYKDYKKGVDEWRDYLMKNSEPLREQALMEYLKGDINFMDYITIVGNTFSEETKCLEFVNNCNEASLKIGYILHKDIEH